MLVIHWKQLFTVTGTDQFGETVIETVEVDYNVFQQLSWKLKSLNYYSVAISGVDNEAASDTASVGVAIAADVVSFGLPDAMVLLQM